MIHKKAESLALRVVIVGIILLIVLVTVLIIFGGGIGSQRRFLDNTTDTITSCTPGQDCGFIEQIIRPNARPNDIEKIRNKYV